MKRYLILALLTLVAAMLPAQTFYDHYNKGLKNQKKGNLDAAEECFLQAIDMKEADGERVRTYGVNFIDYFPNRELGVVYYEMKDYENARKYLMLSQQYQPSERAREYLSRLPESELAQNKTEPEQVLQDQGLKHTAMQETTSGQAGQQEDPAQQSPAAQSGGKEAPVPAGTALTTIPVNTDNTKPLITITSPPLRDFRSVDPVTNETKQITITGRATDASGIYQVLVNGTDASLNAEGEFRADVFLRIGVNDIVVQATDIHQNTGVKEFSIVRADLEVAQNELLEDGGKYYALIIGVSDYVDPLITDLDGLPIRDAQMLAGILTQNYVFEKDNIIFLKNPERIAILRAFDYLSNTITVKDNLLIFYAGHGYYDENTELGYWLPADAEAQFTANWIYNDVLVANLKRIKSKHTLLISDACFSGSIFKTRSMMANAPTAYQKKYELPSRKAITSGVLKTVPNKSVFLQYLTDRLDKNQEQYFSASQLFQSIEIPVGNNSPNTPMYGDIQNVGDEGGDFIFIRR